MSTGNVGDEYVAPFLRGALGDLHTSEWPDFFHFACFLTNPLNDGSGTEVGFADGYERVEIENTTANFPVSTGGVGTNGLRIDLPVPSADWGVVPYWALMDDATDGNVCFHGRLGGTSPKNITNGSTLYVPANTLVIKIKRSMVS